jgi:hypothetical protein
VKLFSNHIYNRFVKFLLIICFETIVVFCAYSQKNTKDSLIAPTYLKDTSIVVDSSQYKSEIETTVQYSCNDSIVMNNEEKKVYLYGNAKVVYGNRTIEAYYIEIFWGLNEVKAYGLKDTLTNKIKGRPVFREGSDMYVADEIRYNFKTGKGLIRGIVTKQGEGFIHGDPVKKTTDAIYVKQAYYTTCNHANPHFSIRANKLKVIPNDKVVTGPFHLELMGIPTPIGFPLGFFPITKRGKSGIIVPTFGEQRSRGFFLSQGGYYFAINDYVGAKIIGDIYTNGSFRIGTDITYKKRYAFNGNLQINYSKIKDGFDDNTPVPELYNVRWTHRTESNKSSSLIANVNISSSKYYAQNSYNPVSYSSADFMSNITYNKSFKRSPFNLSVVARQTQNVNTNLTTINAPIINLSMNRIYPFKTSKNEGEKWFEKINFAYNGSTEYKITNQFSSTSVVGDTILPFNKRNFETILNSNGQWGARHTIPLSTTFKLFKNINVNPQANYTEYWYANKLNYAYDNTTNKVSVKDTIKGFNRASAYNFTTSVTTRIYGTYLFKGEVLKGLRHTMIPSVTYTYTPDFSQNEKYYQRFTQSTDSKGNQIPYNVYQGYLYGGPSNGLVNSLTFKLQNTLEGKARNRKDTSSANASKKIKLLENVEVAGSYNFSADSLNFSTLQFNARNKFFERLDIAFTSMFDPYIYVLDSISTSQTVYQRRVNEFAFQNNQGLAKLINYNFSMSLNLNRKGNSLQSNSLAYNSNTPVNMSTLQYVDFDIPWNLFINYNINYSRTGYNPSNYTQSIRLNGDFNLTSNWKIKFNSGYDLLAKKITWDTQVSVVRDLHCWQMSFNVIPFGSRQSYFFTINAKSSMLKDLKAKKTSSTYNGGSF